MATSLGPEGAELRDGSWGLGWEGKRLLGGLTGAPLPTVASSEAIQAPAPLDAVKQEETQPLGEGGIQN